MTSYSASSSDTLSDDRKLIGHKPIALDGGYGWWVVLGSFLIHVFVDGFVYSFGVFGQSLVMRYDASNKGVSIILSVLSGLMYAIGPVSAIICNRMGCRAAAIVGAIVAVIGSFVALHTMWNALSAIPLQPFYEVEEHGKKEYEFEEESRKDICFSGMVDLIGVDRMTMGLDYYLCFKVLRAFSTADWRALIRHIGHILLDVHILWCLTYGWWCCFLSLV
uniref:Uncharacterized protein n=1 Tax=Ditylenchus dipsaci TaxID=166011 RepID=A0A915DLG3_9BILA